MHHKAECTLNKAKCERNCGFEGSGRELRDHECVNYLKGIIIRLQQCYSSERLAKASLKEDHGECQKRIDSLTREIRDLRKQIESKAEETKVLQIARQKIFESLAKTENEKLLKENRELWERIDRKDNVNNEILVQKNQELQIQIELLKKENATAKDELENFRKKPHSQKANTDFLDILDNDAKRLSTIERVST